MLTVQIMAKNEPLDALLASLQPFRPEIQIIPRNTPADVLRNSYIPKAKYDWMLWLEPWEIFAAGHQAIITTLKRPAAYRLQVMQETTISKEIRFWHRSLNLSFVNPVHETIHTDAILLPEPIVYTQYKKQDFIADLAAIEKWKTQYPMAPEPYYYHAYNLLAQKKYQDFLAVAGEFLFHRNYGIPAVMTKYYMAMTLLYVLNDGRSAIKHIAECLAVHPLMAEFWCLLGDVFYKTAEYEKARVFYENAILLGEKRLQTDDYPIEIPKYREYPEEMIKSCDNMLKNTVYVSTKSNDSGYI